MKLLRAATTAAVLLGVTVAAGTPPAGAASFGVPTSFRLTDMGQLGYRATYAMRPDGQVAAAWTYDIGLWSDGPVPPAVEAVLQGPSDAGTAPSFGTQGAEVLAGVAFERDGSAVFAWEKGAQGWFARCVDGRCAPARELASDVYPDGRPAFTMAGGDRRSVIAWASAKAGVRYRVVQGAHAGPAHTLEAGRLPELTRVGGKIVALWRGTRGRLRSAVLAPSAERFGRPRTALATAPAGQVSAIGGDDGALASWDDARGHLVVAPVDGAGRLGARQTFPVAAADARIAQGPDGRAVVAYAQGGCFSAVPSVAIQAQTRVPGGRFGAPVSLGTAYSCTLTSAAVDGRGRTTIAWLDAASGRPVAAVAEASGPFAAAQPLDASPCVAVGCRFSDLAVVAGGVRTTAVWVQSGTGSVAATAGRFATLG